MSSVSRLGAVATLLSVLLLVTGLPNIQTSDALAAEAGALLSDVQVSELQDLVYKHPTIFGGLWGDATTHIATLSIAPGSASEPLYGAAMRATAQFDSASDSKLKFGPKLWSLK